MTITHSHRRAGLALLATGVLLMGACGGGDDDEDAREDQTEETDEETGGESSANETDVTSTPLPSVNPDAPAADSEFCQGAMAAISASVSQGADGDDGSLDAAEQLEAPDEIAEAWHNVLSTSREMADLDYTDPEASTRAQQAYEEIADDQALIISYLQEDCGIDLGAGTDGSVPTPPSTGA
ncbi:MAG TPA: hypothetical protein VIL36_09910 [Acidimicrobiales bacterium]